MEKILKDIYALWRSEPISAICLTTFIFIFFYCIGAAFGFSKSEAADWVQAIGSIIAIVATGSIAMSHHAESMELARKIRMSEFREQFNLDKQRRIETATVLAKLASSVARDALEYISGPNTKVDMKKHIIKIFKTDEMHQLRDEFSAFPVTQLGVGGLIEARGKFLIPLNRALDYMARAKQLLEEENPAWEHDFDIAATNLRRAYDAIALFHKAIREINAEQPTAPILQ